ncbi:MAG: DUF616 domain-containing protein [Phycisphaerae bacterium]|nr:DUF616 domain-containing protein [Phycisphaerae bacterium]
MGGSTSSDLTRERSRIAVVTAVAGGYDDLIPPRNRYEGVDYIAYLDAPATEVAGWEVRPLPRWSSDPRHAARRDAKLPKILASLVLPGYDYYLWHDATHDLLVDPRELVHRFLPDPGDEVAVFRHWSRDCVYAEGREVRVFDLDTSDNIRRQLDAYRSAGFPPRAGLFELPVILRRASPRTTRLELAWWEQICRYSSRDQLSFPFACWKLGIDVRTISPGTAFRNELVRAVRRHKIGGRRRSRLEEAKRWMSWKWGGLLRRARLR